MKIENVLVLYKLSAYETSGRNPVFKRAHETHYRTLAAVGAALKKMDIRHRLLRRGRPFDGDAYDLVIVVGGDGTFLEAARSMKTTPLLGVNSDARHSVGKLCSVDGAGLPRVLRRALAGKGKIRKLARLEIALTGRRRPFLVSNDFLVCHACPAAMSHYALHLNGKTEQQRSSGLWVSTAAGSTGAARSAGGRALPPGSQKVQYRPRELFGGHGVRYRLKGGFLNLNHPAVVVSQMQEGMLYIDGAHFKWPFRYGARLEVFRSRSPLKVLS